MNLTKNIKYILFRPIQNNKVIQRRYKSLIPGEPSGPVLKTAIPGPKSKELLQELNKLQQAGTVSVFGDYQQCLGNYFADADRNILLDVYSQMSSVPVGYNHPDIINLFRDKKNVKTLINRPALGVFPCADYVDLLEDSFMSIAPKGLKHIHPMMCGSCANENAIKTSFIAFMKAIRGDKPFTPEERKSCMYNSPPGCPNISVLSFKGGFHGRTLATLAATHTNDTHKLDMVVFDWPTAYFPKYKYPLKKHERENKDEDKRSLTTVEEKFHEWAKKGNPIAAVIVEPIQSEGGHNQASKDFFHQLQKIVKKNKAYLIMDEVQTGGGVTGKFWCHEHFDLPIPPDAVTFSRKMQLGGFYFTSELRPNLPSRIFNTWMGDPPKILMLKEIINIIKRDKLLDNVLQVGKKFKSGLLELEKQYPQLLNSTRGIGTFLAISARDNATRDKIIYSLKQKGVLCGESGQKSIRFRPMLVFQESHTAIFLDIFNKVLKELKK